MQSSNLPTRFRTMLRGVRRIAGGGVEKSGAGHRVISAWVVVSAGLVRCRREEDVREGFAGFVREHLSATDVAFVPGSMAGGDGGGAGKVTLELTGTGERVVVTRARMWTEEETELVGRAAGMVDALLEGISRLRAAERESVTDALTGLLNRRTLDRMLDREVLMAGRHGTPLCVAVVDVDSFKLVNDRLGHEAGDVVLREVGMTIMRVLRGSDLAFRTGGDEFTVVLPHTGLGQAVTAMEKVRRTVSSLGKVTLSVGVAEWKAGTNGRVTLRAADAAVYQAKADARDCTRAAA